MDSRLERLVLNPARTTRGGWPGLIKWGGETNWAVRQGQPASAEFEIISLPN
jgi:hypothetical protein